MSVTCPTLLSFHLGAGYWMNLSPEVAKSQLACFAAQAREALATAGIPVPHKSSLDLIVMAAAEAKILFFHAASYEPSTAELNQFFVDFVVRAVRI